MPIRLDVQRPNAMKFASKRSRCAFVRQAMAPTRARHARGSIAALTRPTLPRLRRDTPRRAPTLAGVHEATRGQRPGQRVGNAARSQTPPRGDGCFRQLLHRGVTREHLARASTEWLGRNVAPPPSTPDTHLDTPKGTCRRCAQSSQTCPIRGRQRLPRPNRNP